MKTKMRSSFAIALVASALTPGVAFAFIIVDTTQNLGSNYIHSACSVSVSTNEEVYGFSSACNLDEDNITIKGEPLPDQDIGYPRQSPYFEVWQLWKLGAPKADARYCTRFGLADGPNEPLYVAWKYIDDPFGTYRALPGDHTCRTAEPQVKAYYQVQCFGAFVWVFSVDSLIPGVHLSYRLESDPSFCWAVAVHGGN